MDTFTIPLEGRKQRVISTHAKCAPSIEGCQSRTMAGYGGSSKRSIRDVVKVLPPNWTAAGSGKTQKPTY
jgi:hypothetical protein